MAMDVKSELVDLLDEIDVTCDIDEGDDPHIPGARVIRIEGSDYVADHLIANGVTVQRWIPVEERLPENEVDVLILVERRLYYGERDIRKRRFVCMAFHTDGKTNTEESGYTWDLWDTDATYDEEADAYIIPEGWWETVRYGEEFAAVSDFVTHWMPMPKGPEEGTHGRNEI